MRLRGPLSEQTGWDLAPAQAQPSPLDPTAGRSLPLLPTPKSLLSLFIHLRNVLLCLSQRHGAYNDMLWVSVQTWLQRKITPLPLPSCYLLLQSVCVCVCVCVCISGQFQFGVFSKIIMKEEITYLCTCF